MSELLTREDLAVLRRIEKRVRDDLIKNDRSLISVPRMRAGESHDAYLIKLHAAEQRYFAELTRKARAKAKPLVEAARQEMLKQRIAKQERISKETKKLIRMRKEEALARKKARLKKAALILKRQSKKRVARKRVTALKKRRKTILKKRK